LQFEKEEGEVFNPFVEISIKGIAQDAKNNKPFITNTVQLNTFHPVFKPATGVF